MPVTKKCEHCGKEFPCFPCDYERRRFCSIACKSIATQKRVTIICKTCHKTKVLEQGRSNEQYCSKKCEGISRRIPIKTKIIRLRIIKGDCWIWQGSKNAKGYGITFMNGKTMLAHRASFLAFRGEIPPKKLVCHTCDNPSCVNPSHLFLGTAQDNTSDMINKGRMKLVIHKTEVEKMRNDYSSGVLTKAEIARKYNRDGQHVGRILRGETRYAY